MVAAGAVFVNMTPSPRHVMTHVTDPGLGLVITIYSKQPLSNNL